MNSEMSAFLDDPAVGKTRGSDLLSPQGGGRLWARPLVFVGREAGAAIGDERLEEHERMRTARRLLIELEAAFYEDHGDPLDAASQAGFLGFLRYQPNAAIPLLGAESTGHVVATWSLGRACLSLRFLDRYRFHYALTDEAGERRWGTEHAMTFLEALPQAGKLIAGA